MEDMSLTHYGVLGMKWGVRKDPSSSSGKNSANKKTKSSSRVSKESAPKQPQAREPSDDYLAVSRVKKGPLSTMSNQDIHRANQRMQLERQYLELTKKKQNPIVKTGLKIVSNVAQQAAQQALQNMLKNLMTSAMSEPEKKK